MIFGGQMKLMRIAITGLISVTGFGSVGIAYACLVEPPTPPPDCPTTGVRFVWVEPNDNGVTSNHLGFNPVDSGDNRNDPYAEQTAGAACPRYTLDVANLNGHVEPDGKTMTVTLNNGYPAYWPTAFFGIINDQTTPATIQSIRLDERYTGAGDNIDDDIPEIEVDYSGVYAGQVINSHQEVMGNINIEVTQAATQNNVHNIRVVLVLSGTCQESDTEGTPGFWRNNWNHFYSTASLLQWLQSIDSSSKFINDPNGGSWTVNDMYTILDAGVSGGATSKSRFLRHYLATRLNAASGRTHLQNTHNVTGITNYQYLGLAHPSSATLSEIIAAIESKSPTKNSQWDTLKNVCDALNNLWI